MKSKMCHFARDLALMCMALFSVAGIAPARDSFDAAPWSLTPDQRRAFLHSYAPIIFKSADENRGRIGQDWITNFDFDRDGFFLPNNGENWSRELANFISKGSHPNWRIRPTLYSAIVEFMHEGQKSAVLIYHVYHAMDGGHTHDWERIEIRLDGLHGEPGSGERVRYAVLTEHHLSAGRRVPDADLQFLETDNGRHLLIWQAPQTNKWFRARKGELHFVRSRSVELAESDQQGKRARVRLAGGKEQPFHYVFVPRAAPEAVKAWKAKPLGRCNANQLASGSRRTSVPMGDVRRIVYELQDFSDLFAGQWQTPGNGSWRKPFVPVLLAAPLIDEDGIQVVPAGPQIFANGTPDPLFGRDDVDGFLGKNAFWGTYLFDRLAASGQGGMLPDLSGAIAARKPHCLEQALEHCGQEGFWQHDFFVHSGERSSGADNDERGMWLKGDWYKEDAGGFDGRWAQIFPDRSNTDTACDMPKDSN